MESETASGLHFPTGHYSPIRRTSMLTAQAESFDASNGERALKFVDAHAITARFDPWGVLYVNGGSVRFTSNQARSKSRFTKRTLKRSRQSRGSRFFCRTACISSGLNPSMLM